MEEIERKAEWKGSIPQSLGFPAYHSKLAIVEAIEGAEYHIPVPDFLFKEKNWLVGQKFSSKKMTSTQSENEDRDLAVVDVISRCSDKKKSVQGLKCEGSFLIGFRCCAGSLGITERILSFQGLAALVTMWFLDPPAKL